MVFHVYCLSTNFKQKVIIRGVLFLIISLIFSVFQKRRNFLNRLSISSKLKKFHSQFSIKSREVSKTQSL